MQVKLTQNMFWPPGTAFIEPIGKVLDLPEDVADDWIKRGLAVEEKPISYKPPPPEEPPKKGRR